MQRQENDERMKKTLLTFQLLMDGRMSVVPQFFTHTLDSVSINNEDLRHVVSQHLTGITNIHCRLCHKKRKKHHKVTLHVHLVLSNWDTKYKAVVVMCAGSRRYPACLQLAPRS